MLTLLTKKVLQRNYARLRAGDYKPLLRFDAKDVRFRFPGNNSWATELFADEIVVKGPPWNTTLCLRGHDYLRSPDGETVYANRYVIWGHAKWGLLKDYEVYEDTEQSAALDRYLADRGDAVAVAYRAKVAAPA